jgi:hypothetical protein
MTALVTLVLVVAITVSVVSWLGRRTRVDLAPTGWDLADAARRQIPLLVSRPPWRPMDADDRRQVGRLPDGCAPAERA